ncbi:hypothetical protein BJ742DRAFT_780249 [Cladochytrium replicatum]|nr:hypothetical protein BJ742DRAFT_780249 [Cladochytrium replicatum]
MPYRLARGREVTVANPHHLTSQQISHVIGEFTRRQAVAVPRKSRKVERFTGKDHVRSESEEGGGVKITGCRMFGLTFSVSNQFRKKELRLARSAAGSGIATFVNALQERGSPLEEELDESSDTVFVLL